MPSWLCRRMLLRGLSSPKTNLKNKRTLQRRRLQQRRRKKKQRLLRPLLRIRKRSLHPPMTKKQLKKKTLLSRAHQMRNSLQKMSKRLESWLKSRTKPSKTLKQNWKSTRKTLRNWDRSWRTRLQRMIIPSNATASKLKRANNSQFQSLPRIS